MRRIVLVLTAALIASPLLAADGYSFHLKVTDGKSALLANPDFEKLHMPPAQLEKAAGNRVLLLDHAKDAHWVWLMLSWLDRKPADEYGIDSHGVAGLAAGADFGLTPVDNDTVRIRCLHAHCQVNDITMAKGETKQFPFDSDFELVFDQR
jgi:hypothetical protein